MAFINWSKDLSVGIAEIDSQHQILIGLINDLHNAMMENATKPKLAGILTGLVDYTRKHFIAEEKIFHRINYPESEAHIAEHKNFVLKVTQFIEEYNQGSTTLSLDMMVYLKEWTVDHIQGSDKRYKHFFNEHGII